MQLTGPFWSLAAYQFDAAVVAFGLMIENARSETVTIGNGSNRRTRPRWTLEELLDDGFQFPREDGLALFRSVEGYEEVG